MASVDCSYFHFQMISLILAPTYKNNSQFLTFVRSSYCIYKIGGIRCFVVMQTFIFFPRNLILCILIKIMQGVFFSSIDYILKKSIIVSKFSSFGESKWDEYQKTSFFEFYVKLKHCFQFVHIEECLTCRNLRYSV